jgi:hypothetical protein
MRSLAPRGRVPSTPAEWQDAVDAANALLLIDAAKAYGLVTGGPDVNIERCEDILARGLSRGIRPRHGSAEEYTRQWNREAMHGDVDGAEGAL